MLRELSDNKFVELIFEASDCLGIDYIEEAKCRKNNVIPLYCDILLNEKYYKWNDKRFWGVVHAVYVLGVLKDIEALDAFLAAGKFADEHDVDWILDALPECYFRLGTTVIPRLKQWIDHHKSIHNLAIASEILGLWNLLQAFPETRSDIEDFLLRIIEAPETDIEVRTNLIADFAKLGRTDLLPLFRKMYQLERADTTVFTLGEIEKMFEKQVAPTEVHFNIEEFYDLEEINRRQNIWQLERSRMEKESYEEYIVNNLELISPKDSCPCGSGKPFQNCHQKWAIKKFNTKSRAQKNVITATMLTGMPKIAERHYETELRRILAEKGQAHLFVKLKKRICELTDAPLEDFISGKFMVYFEPVFSELHFDNEEMYKSFMKSFMEYFNAISRQRFELN